MNKKLSSQSVISLEANYTASIVDEETLYKIFLEKNGYSDSEESRQILEFLKNTNRAEISRMISSYTGSLSNHIRTKKAHNKIPLLFRWELAKKIAGISTVTTFEANYIAVGNGTLAVSDADILLDNEYVRGLIDQRTTVDNIAYLDKFFTSWEIGGTTMTEVGTFCDGTVTLETWTLLSRVLLNESFGATETLTLNVTISFTSAN